MVPTVIRYALVIALGVIAVDWLTELAVRFLPSEDPLLAVIGLANLFLNVAIFGYGGYMGCRAEGIVRAGAEVGVIAAVLVAAAAVLRSAVSPLPDAGPLDAQRVVELFALNIAIGGIAALVGALSARRREKERK